jgi:cysteine synthase A
MAVHDNVTELIGRTPLVELHRFGAELPARLVGKLESVNPGGSVKDRIALAMIEAAEKSSELTPGGTIVEPTSGNTGIGLAMVAAAKGYGAVFTMPEGMRVERRRIITAFSARIVLTPTAEGMPGAVEIARRLAADNGWFMPHQFENPANPDAHRRTTAREIRNDLKGGLDAFVAGVGSSGTVTGVGKDLKRRKPSILVVAVEPDESPVLSGGTAGPHRIQGIGPGFVPAILDPAAYDEVMRIRGPSPPRPPAASRRPRAFSPASRAGPPCAPRAGSPSGRRWRTRRSSSSSPTPGSGTSARVFSTISSVPALPDTAARRPIRRTGSPVKRFRR